jgi:hypothetical protein
VKQAEQPVMADMYASAIGTTPVHQDQTFIAAVGQCVTLTFKVTFRSGETCAVTQSPDTAFTTNPARGNWTSKNVWCPGPADADKTITRYGLYRNASGATINDTVIVHVSR